MSSFTQLPFPTGYFRRRGPHVFNTKQQCTALNIVRGARARVDNLCLAASHFTCRNQLLAKRINLATKHEVAYSLPAAIERKPRLVPIERSWTSALTWSVRVIAAPPAARRCIECQPKLVSQFLNARPGTSPGANKHLRALFVYSRPVASSGSEYIKSAGFSNRTPQAKFNIYDPGHSRPETSRSDSEFLVCRFFMV